MNSRPPLTSQMHKAMQHPVADRAGEFLRFGSSPRGIGESLDAEGATAPESLRQMDRCSVHTLKSGPQLRAPPKEQA